MKKKIFTGIAMILLNIFFALFKAQADSVFLDEFTENDAGSRFVIEATKYTHRTSGANGAWWEVDGKEGRFIEGPRAGEIAPTAKTSVYGNYMEALGKFIGDVTPTSDNYSGPFLDFNVYIVKVGTYDLYVHWTGNDGDSDSLYAFILKPDGTLLRRPGPDYLDFFLFHGRTYWIWDNIGIKNRIDAAYAGRNAYAAWIIPEPGIYTIRLALRETGTAVDRLIFQTENLHPPSTSEKVEHDFGY